ncbi:cytochrome P450 [Aspergillus alliaceus]|uniref:Cytochrome P450 n=1 Tax=Petromyces alliaceus TaxID=209559 RepID=A0A5N7BRV4_PETAA|nr:cytochrome P450 [Aspergillus alliaceus]
MAIIAKIAAGLICVYIVRKLLFPSVAHLPKGLPIIGTKDSDWFPFLQAAWRNALNLRGNILEAYAKHKDQAAILPIAGPGGQTFVLLPASETKLVTDQPNTVLSLREVIVQGLLYEYTISDNFIVSNPTHTKLITTTLTNQIANLLPGLANETIRGFEQQWGTDTESFRDVTIWDSMGAIVSRATNYAFVGLPYCRDSALLNAGIGFARALPFSQLLLSFTWKPLRPLASLLFTLPCRYYENRFTQILIPEIEHRLHDIFNPTPSLCSGETSGEAEKKNDFLQWCIEQAKESGDPRMWQPRTLAGRILLMNLVSIHTSSLTIVNVMLDLASSTPEVLEELRAEVKQVLDTCGGQWTKLALGKMEKLDSVLRESARLNTLVAVGLRRRVVAKEGFTTTSGVHLPCGNFCAVHNLGVVHDPNVYEQPDTFKPFRFVGLRRDVSSDDPNKDHVQRARLTFPATGYDYLAFGNGRQACPGRFFAASELKLMLAYALMYYDLEIMDSRPRDRWIGILRIPSSNAKLRVRRRKGSVQLSMNNENLV